MNWRQGWSNLNPSSAAVHRLCPKTYGLDFLSCGTFLVIMALMCGTTEGLTMEGYVASFIIMAAIKLDTNTCFLSYKQLLFYSISITIALYHSNDV